MFQNIAEIDYSSYKQACSLPGFSFYSLLRLMRRSLSYYQEASRTVNSSVLKMSENLQLHLSLLFSAESGDSFLQCLQKALRNWNTLDQEH